MIDRLVCLASLTHCLNTDAAFEQVIVAFPASTEDWREQLDIHFE
jgi:hypothetical protein